MKRLKKGRKNLFNEDIDMNGIGKDIEAKASSQEKDIELRTQSKRMVYLDNVKSFKSDLDKIFETINVEDYSMDLYGNTYNANMDIIRINFVVNDSAIEKIDEVINTIKKAFVARKLDKYFDPDYIGTEEVAEGERFHMLFLKWDHEWAKWKKDPIDYIDQGGDEEEGGGGGGFY